MYYIIFYIESDRYCQRFDSIEQAIDYKDCLERDLNGVQVFIGKGA